MKLTANTMYIDGQWVPAVADGMRQIINPFNQEVIAEVAEGDRRDAQKAIVAARQTFDKGVWSSRPAAERGDVLVGLKSRVWPVKANGRYFSVGRLIT